MSATRPIRRRYPRPTSHHAVVIAGAGPTGMTLAAELAIAGVDVAVVERRETIELEGSRAGGLHARTLEIFDMRGIADRFMTEGQAAQVAGFAWFPLDISDVPTRFNHGLALRQPHIERILAAWVEELGVPILRGREVVDLTQDEEGVSVDISDGSSLRCAYLVGCDGGRSRVRNAAGVDFVGWDASVSHLIAEAHTTEEPPLGLRRDEQGIHAFNRLEDGRIGIMVTEAEVPSRADPTLEDLSRALERVYGTDYGLHGPAWVSRFTDASRQAAEYRRGRVLLAGDAAHVHYPAGGQGLNTGVQDAVNLGWKLARVVRGEASVSLLDSYHAERHPVAARVLRNTMAQVALLRTDARTDALRETISELIALDPVRVRLAAMISALDVRYDLGDGHPLLGRRMPDLDLRTAAGETRVHTLLRDGRPLLLDLSDGREAPPREAPADLRVVSASCDGPWQLPVIGQVEPPRAVLIRPDGHVAWVAGDDEPSIDDALRATLGRALV